MGPNDTRSMALFCDFENVALGVKDAKYEQFDIGLVLERLLLKGSIVVKKAYCDWQRYKEFKAAMHQASFELIEIPHVRMSGKNSADIRMVVDALDLCYTKSHVDTFVIISGDSDFSPLVSKLRENNKTVIGVGVKNSTSDLLIANCDEFIFYDDLVRVSKAKPAGRRRGDARRDGAKGEAARGNGEGGRNGDAARTGEADGAAKAEAAGKPEAATRAEAPKREGGRSRGGRGRRGAAPAEDAVASVAAGEAALEGANDAGQGVATELSMPGAAAAAQAGARDERDERDAADGGEAADGADAHEDSEAREDRVQAALESVAATVEALLAERGEDEKIWGSMVKQTLKRRKPGFSESYYGYRSFGELLEDAKKRKLLILERDEKSGQHIIRLPADDQAAA
jgi:uncharacterized protein (TIGR00288 family)